MIGDQAAFLSLVGQQVDHHKIEKQLHLGRQSAVYQARDRRSDALQAVKVWHTGALTAAGAEMVLTRGERLKSLVHPNLVPILHVGLVGPEQPYVVMGLIKGRPLSAMLDPEPDADIPPALPRLRLARSIARGLAALFERDLAHAALEPGHILIRPGQAPVLIDTITPPLLGISAHGATVVPGQFVAPESLPSGQVSWHSNLYSFGLILYALLTGWSPDADPLPDQGAGPPRPLAQVRPDLQTSTYQLVDVCLRQQPWARYQDSQTWLLDLEAALAAEKSAPAAPGFVTDEPARTRRVGLGWILLLILLVVVAVIALVILWLAPDRLAGQAAVVGLLLGRFAGPGLYP